MIMQKHSASLPELLKRATTLFLDRDGVLNIQRPNDYVKQWDEFIFVPGIREVLAAMSKQFDRIVVVTNQQGVGKGIMSRHDLEVIHARMLEEVERVGGKIDAVYCATETAEHDVQKLRKPEIGMALQAKHDFPEIDFSTSIMIGDSAGDMGFGKNAAMTTVFVGKPSLLTEEEKKLVDHYCRSLQEFLEGICYCEN